MPKVSVIIPNYNHASFLKKRIDSVLSQTYSDFEVIILDDASTDASVTIINQYQDHPKVKYILLNEVNSGSTFIQWKKGISLAEGKYVWIAESDDFAKANFLEVLISKLESHNDVSIAFCQSFFVNEKDGISPNLLKNENVDSVYLGEEFISTRLSSHNDIFNASMAIFRKEFFDKIKDESYLKFKFCGDWCFWILLAEQGNVVESAEFLNYYRKHEQSVSQSSNNRGLFFIEGLAILQKIKNRLGYRQRLKIIRNWSNRLINSNLKKNTYLKIIWKFSIKFPSFFYFHVRSLAGNALKSWV